MYRESDPQEFLNQLDVLVGSVPGNSLRDLIPLPNILPHIQSRGTFPLRRKIEFPIVFYQMDL
jgi:hypothetical protein